MSEEKQTNDLYSNEQVKFIGPRKVIGDVHSALIKLKPQPWFSSGATGNDNSAINLGKEDYKTHKNEIDQIMEKFNYKKK